MSVGIRERMDAWAVGFLPAYLRGDDEVEEARQALLAIRISILMGFVFAALVVVSLVSTYWSGALANGALCAVCFGTPPLLRRIGRYKLILNGVLAACFASMLWLSLSMRGAGVHSSTIALAELPLFATLLGGVRTGAVWAGIGSAAGALIGVLGHYDVVEEQIPGHGRLFHEHAALLIITLTLFLVGVLYERRKKADLASIVQLEAKRRVAERDKIEAVSAANLARADRFASLGRIAAAAAHEINNPLAVVSSNLSFLERRGASDTDADVAAALREAHDGVERITRIVADLQSASAEGSNTTEVDMTRVVTTAIELAKGHTKHRAEVKASLDVVGRVRGDEARLVQATLNLLVNAAQAVPEGRSAAREITIALSQEGEEVLLVVDDDGDGLSMDDAARAGLALARDAVAAIGGRLELESRPGRTRVRMVLPALAGTKREPVMVAVAAPPDPLDILVVDDEPALLRAFKRLLRPHRVASAHGGRQALERLGESAFDLVLCDLMMPDLSGMDVYERVRAERPEVADAIVFMTGGTFTERSREFRGKVPNLFLDKPVDANKVLAILKERARRRAEKEGGVAV